MSVSITGADGSVEVQDGLEVGSTNRDVLDPVSAGTFPSDVLERGLDLSRRAVRVAVVAGVRARGLRVATSQCDPKGAEVSFQLDELLRHLGEVARVVDRVLPSELADVRRQQRKLDHRQTDVNKVMMPRHTAVLVVQLLCLRLGDSDFDEHGELLTFCLCCSCRWLAVAETESCILALAKVSTHLSI